MATLMKLKYYIPTSLSTVIKQTWLYIALAGFVILVLTGSSQANVLIEQNVSGGGADVTVSPGQSFQITNNALSITSVNASIYVASGGWANVYLTLANNASRGTILSTSSIINISSTATYWYSFDLNIPSPNGTYYIAAHVSSSSGNMVAWRTSQYNAYVYGQLDTVTSYDAVFRVHGEQFSTVGLDGIVYKNINGVQVPISNAVVSITNNLSTSTQVTTTNSAGYYIFNYLTAGSTYVLQAKKADEYDDSSIYFITTSLDIYTRQDIQLFGCTVAYSCYEDKQFVLFKARWLYCISTCDISNANITAYKNGDTTPYISGITDSTGSVSFLLFKTQLYRITIINASQSVNKEETLYPKDTEYIFLITNSPIAWKTHIIEKKDAITISVTRNIINATHTYINVSYNDSLAQTTALNIGISRNNTSVASWSGAGNASRTFTISNYSGNSYLVNISGTHTTYGALGEVYSVFFEKTVVGITGIPEALWLWFMIGIMFFTAATFTSSTVEIGLIIVCAEGWIGLAIGAFSSLNTTKFGIVLTLVSILGVLAYIKKQSIKEGMA